MRWASPPRWSPPSRCRCGCRPARARPEQHGRARQRGRPHGRLCQLCEPLSRQFGERIRALNPDRPPCACWATGWKRLSAIMMASILPLTMRRDCAFIRFHLPGRGCARRWAPISAPMPILCARSRGSNAAEPLSAVILDYGFMGAQIAALARLGIAVVAGTHNFESALTGQVPTPSPGARLAIGLRQAVEAAHERRFLCQSRRRHLCQRRGPARICQIHRSRPAACRAQFHRYSRQFSGRWRARTASS